MKRNSIIILRKSSKFRLRFRNQMYLSQLSIGISMNSTKLNCNLINKILRTSRCNPWTQLLNRILSRCRLKLNNSSLSLPRNASQLTKELLMRNFLWLTNSIDDNKWWKESGRKLHRTGLQSINCTPTINSIKTIRGMTSSYKEKNFLIITIICQITPSPSFS